MLYRIVLHLARSREFPDGSDRRGYEIHAPLDASGHLDPEEWKHRKRSCRVRRFWAGEPARHGLLIHRAGGAEGATWLLDYDDSTETDDEAGYRLGSHRFAKGEYVSVKDEDGSMHTFRIDEVISAEKPAPVEKV